MNIQARMRDIIQAEARAVAAIQVDAHYERAVRLMYECPGKILTTGIGKASKL